ncbi:MULTISPECIES: plasmid partition protein ParG [Arsenophonus]|uniref:Plasmid partition protein ParG n=1 Tax=Arsenophonus nasoniae TaxID=638 RepID=A0AA95GBA9_9GAMM|nr:MULTISPECIES: plasmid partition protein ParG [Arsenophonus]WGL93980.1 plasmid partition protein ParG [Arsenophonus nasoniae]
MSKNKILSAGRPALRNKEKTLASIKDEIQSKRVNFDLTFENHLKLKMYAAKRGKTIKEVLTEFVDKLPN